jgi:hypothetical protein
MQSRSPFEDLEHFAPAPANEGCDRPDGFVDAGGHRRRVRREWVTPFVSGALVAAIVAGSSAVIAANRRDAGGDRPPTVIPASDQHEVAEAPRGDIVDSSMFGFRAAPRRVEHKATRKVESRSRFRLAPAPATPTVAVASAPVTPPARPRPRRKVAPAPPKPELSLYHLYSYRVEDHIFTTDESLVKRKDAWSYDVVAIEGSIFGERVDGTKALTTPDGTVGYVWSAAKKGTLALYSFYGPEGEYFTTSDAMASELSDEPGWESTGIAGYVAPA